MWRGIAYLSEQLRAFENFEGYVGRVVSNLCVDFLRSKYPARARLKDALRDVFRRHGDLVSWQHEDEILCGFAAWRDTGKPAISGYDVEAKMNAFLAARFADQDVRAVPLSSVVAELFDWIGGAIQIDVLVRMLAYIRDIREQEIASWDDHVAAEFELDSRRRTRSVEPDIETNEVLRRLWRIVKHLPPKQRDAFALRFHDDAGRDLFTVLLAAGIVDWKELAEGLGRLTCCAHEFSPYHLLLSNDAGKKQNFHWLENKFRLQTVGTRAAIYPLTIQLTTKRMDQNASVREARRVQNYRTAGRWRLASWSA